MSTWIRQFPSTRLWLTVLLAVAGGLLSAKAQFIAKGPWVGAVTPTSAEISLVLFESRLSTLELGTEKNFTTRYIAVPEQPRRHGDVPLLTRYRVHNLQPDTEYFYRVRAGKLREREKIGRFRTPPAPTVPKSFRFAFAGGTQTLSEAGALSEIRYQKPQFYIQLGNLHDDFALDPTLLSHAQPFLDSLDSFARSEILHNMPLVYTWSARDFMAAAVPSPEHAVASFKAYHQLVPHYPLPLAQTALKTATDETSALRAPIAQAFSWARVRVVVLDTRSARGERGTTLLGPRQLAWLKEELAASARTHAVVLIASATSWFATPDSVPDSWGSYAEERDALLAWMAENDVRNVCLLSANGGGLGVREPRQDPWAPAEFQVGQIDQRGLPVAEGDWDQGVLTPDEFEEFFGLIDIEDNRTSMNVIFRGMDQNGRERMTSAQTFPAAE